MFNLCNYPISYVLLFLFVMELLWKVIQLIRAGAEIWVLSFSKAQAAVLLQGFQGGPSGK